MTGKLLVGHIQILAVVDQLPSLLLLLGLKLLILSQRMKLFGKHQMGQLIVAVFVVIG